MIIEAADDIYMQKQCQQKNVLPSALHKGHKDK